MAEEPPAGAIPITNDLVFCLVNEDYKPPRTSSKYIYFCTDNDLVYTAFFADFGPLNLGLACTFCRQLTDAVATATAAGKKVACYACGPHHHSNSAVLVCAYQIFVLGYSAAEAYAPFMGKEPFVPFRDAAFCLNTFPLLVLDCVRAMGKAVSLGHFNYNAFDPARFKSMAQLENGDLSWIVPGKFIAFSGPLSKRRTLGPGLHSLLPNEYVPLFKQLGVSCVVRFNNKCYDKAVFERGGIKHVDLFYEDGGNPTEAILQAFLKLCETEQGAIAVHCKAGLGRTGTNIVAYMVKHYGYTVREAVAWHRICRPGAVVGPQQQFLLSLEQRLQLEGDQYRARMRQHPLPSSSSSSSSSPASGQAALSPPRSALSSRGGGVVLPRPGVLPHERQGGGGAAQGSPRGGGHSAAGTRGSTPVSPSTGRSLFSVNAAASSSPPALSPAPAHPSGPTSAAASNAAAASASSPPVGLGSALGVRPDRESARRERVERQRERHGHGHGQGVA